MSGRGKSGLEAFWRLIKLSQISFAGKKINAILKKDAVFSLALQKLPLFKGNDRVVSRKHWTVIVWIPEKTLLLRLAGKEIQPPPMIGTPLAFTGDPLFLVDQFNGTHSIETWTFDRRRKRQGLWRPGCLLGR